ncbi:hypothetical protein DL764_002741 [Monosporascus ibericus]|uniref:Rhodopsin domain-containing protein n=1 Tax=Monosporascus ibericus TaxID=155417 RepID=A0A4V1XBQ9_9PEZI|nr:hypothetical protein DL764_002741 [Monosporascus ibericus]
MVLFEDHAPGLAAAVITICAFGYLTYGLRAYTRIKYSSWGPEDWCMTAAVPLFTVLSLSCIACAFTGVGAKNRTLELPSNEEYREKGLFSGLAPELTVVSANRLILQTMKFLLYTQYAIMVMFTTMNLIAGLYIVFQCSPVSAAWDTQVIENGGKCNDAHILADIYYATTAVNIVTDWVTAFMPIPILWNVQMNRNSKASVAFILGFFASLSACIRLKYTVGLTAAEDYLYAVSDIVIWGYAENGLGLIVGCVATLKPLFRNVFRLSGSDSYPTPRPFGGGGSRCAFPRGNSRPAYTEFGPESEYELGLGGKNGKDYRRGDMITSTRIHGGRGDDSASSDSESQKEILKHNSPGTIAVSREVHIIEEH